jgi:hypothetical protein
MALAILAAATLSGCGSVGDIVGEEFGVPKRHPIRMAESQVSFIGDPDPILSREAVEQIDRYTEWLAAGNDVRLRYSRLVKGSLNPRFKAVDALFADTETRYFRDEDFVFDKTKLEYRGSAVYLIGRSPSKICLLFRWHFGDTSQGLPGAEGNQELIGQGCGPIGSTTPEQLEHTVFALIDRARFDGGALNRERAAAAAADAGTAAHAPPPVISAAGPVAVSHSASPALPATASPPASAGDPASRATVAMPMPAAVPVSTTVPSAGMPPANAAPPAAAADRAKDIAERLGTLRKLLDQGLITRSEYEHRRKAILDSI